MFFRLYTIVSLLMMMSSCNTIRTGISGKKAPHDQYREKLEKAGFDKTPYGLKWIMEANRSLTQPVSIEIPYKEKGYFAADKPMANGYRFNVKRGEKILVNVTTVPAKGFTFFADLFHSQTENKPALVASIDTLNNTISYEAEQDGSFILRLQTELMWGVEYSFSVTTGPSLAFPVRKNDNPKVSSYWGADRDAGARSHEGIDIFAKKLTPAIAAADGYITRVNENTLGGKVVFLRPDGKNISLYYAHLDSQLVNSGQRVKEGDVIGLIGNTGNARTTPAHLHFGIYTGGGAIDPYPFVNVNRKLPVDISADEKLLNQYVHNVNSSNIYNAPAASSPVIKLPPGNIMRVTAATAKYFQVALPGNTTGFITASEVNTKPLRTQKMLKVERLLDRPDSTAGAITSIPTGTSVVIKGIYGNYLYATYNGVEGWLMR